MLKISELGSQQRYTKFENADRGCDEKSAKTRANKKMLKISEPESQQKSI